MMESSGSRAPRRITYRSNFAARGTVATLPMTMPSLWCPATPPLGHQVGHPSRAGASSIRWATAAPPLERQVGHRHRRLPAVPPPAPTWTRLPSSPGARRPRAPRAEYPPVEPRREPVQETEWLHLVCNRLVQQQARAAAGSCSGVLVSSCAAGDHRGACSAGCHRLADSIVTSAHLTPRQRAARPRARGMSLQRRDRAGDRSVVGAPCLMHHEPH